MSEYMQTAEIAREIRKRLKREFSSTIFKVETKTKLKSKLIEISWSDGQRKYSIKKVLRPFSRPSCSTYKYLERKFYLTNELSYERKNCFELAQKVLNYCAIEYPEILEVISIAGSENFGFFYDLKDRKSQSQNELLTFCENELINSDLERIFPTSYVYRIRRK